MRRTNKMSISKCSNNSNIIILIWIFFAMIIMLMFSSCSALGFDCACEPNLSYFAVRGSDLPCVGCFFGNNSVLVCGKETYDYGNEKRNYIGINCSSNGDRLYLGCDDETTETNTDINVIVCGNIERKSQLGFSYDYDDISSCSIGCVDGCLCVTIDSEDRFGYIIPEAYANDITSKQLDMMLGRTDCMGNKL